jgi:imidazoleglycerol-phosphate dehydratase / histidinol-phosphatase
MPIKVLFIDRDGTLIREPEDQQVDALEKVSLVRSVIPELCTLRDHGYRFVMVTNQDGLGSEAFPSDAFERCQNHVLELFRSQGIDFDEIFVCPHRGEDNCDCRKPRTGLLTRYLAAHDLDLERSAVIGDRETDLELAKRIGVDGFLVDENGDYALTWPGIVDALCRSERAATVERNTSETRIRLAVNLDTETPQEIASGIGFFDHMLEQLSRHGGFAMTLRCDGDLHIDEHHTVEDVAICLGKALRSALDDKRGIGRYGFVLPMDESEAQVCIDLAGRSNLVFEADFPRDVVGELSTEMVRHFFGTLADALRAAIHIRVSGENTHHMVEAIFKAVGRALRQAIRIDSTALPTTKGILA